MHVVNVSGTEERVIGEQKRQHNPGDAASAFIRVLLSEAGRLAGGLTDSEWEDTMAHFDHCCAYTGEPLTNETTRQEHAIPINRESCGLHLYGNVVPATKEANRRKSSKHKEFLKDDPHRLHRIEKFMENAGYHERTRPFGEFHLFCQAQCRLITSLCDANKDYLQELMHRPTHRYESDAPQASLRSLEARSVSSRNLVHEFNCVNRPWIGRLVSSR